MLNFKKGGVFSRGAAPEPFSEESSGVQMLAVWGSPGSGKTTVAVKLAQHLAAKKKNVALVLCDMTTPMLPCICPPSDLDCQKSLGSILAAAHVTESLVQHNCVTHKRYGYLTMIGALKGENEYTYPPYAEQQAREFLDCLKSLAPYIIIDCSSYIAYDILSAVSLMEAEAVLRLVNCDLKSVSYLSSQLPLLKDNRWDADKQYRVASDIKSNEASENIEQVLGNVTFKLPHSLELEAQGLAGDLFRDLALKDSRAFRSELAKISKEVFGT